MRFQIGLAIALATGLAGAAAGCTVSAPPSAFADTHNTVMYTDASAGGDAAIATPDAAVITSDAGTNGSPLCVQMTDGGMQATCDPDTPAGPLCLQPPPDDGGSGYGDAGLACRVEPSQNVSTGGLGSRTNCMVAGQGGDGATCLEASDCAAGFDCVGTTSTTGDAVAGTCRHYCCAGNAECSPPTDTATSPQFCDIQSLTSATTTRVPVCIPITPPGGCQLLPPTASPSCPADETCAVVREDGATSCVQAGNEKAGDPCDTDHCIAGLVCLRSFGGSGGTGPLCYTLCHTAKDDCTAPLTCQGGLPLFQDPSVGVCR